MSILNSQSIQCTRADDLSAATESRLRQALRDTTSQLRDAQNQLVEAQAAQVQSDKDKADLQAKLDAVTAQLKTVSDQAASDKAAADKAIADLKLNDQTLVVHMVDALTTQINALGKPDSKAAASLDAAIADLKSQGPDFAAALDQYNADIQSWVTGYNAYVQLAATTEAQRAKLAAQDKLQQQIIADREAKNLALFQLGNDILTRYEKFGLGDALLAKEPFIGTSRVQLQNLVQDYQNKLLDQKIVPGQPPVTPAPVAARASSSAAIAPANLSQR